MAEPMTASPGSAGEPAAAGPGVHPLLLPVMADLVRTELGNRRARGERPELEEYRARFPALFADPGALREVAFEDYRQRREAAEDAHPGEYRRRYGVDTHGWPAPDPVQDGPGDYLPPVPPTQGSGGAAGGPGHTVALDPARGIEKAARAYQEFRRAGGSADDGPFFSLCLTSGVRAEATEVFREVYRAGPGAADRLAGAVLSMPGVGDDFLGFRVVEELGRGAFGRVFLARQSDLADRHVVLKVSTDLHGESQKLAQLQHTNIVPVYSVHHRPPFQAVCMPYFGATTLEDVLHGLHAADRLPMSGKHFVSTVNGRRRSTWFGTSSRAPASAGGKDPAPAAAPQEPAPAPDPGPEAPSDQAVALRALEGFSYVKAVLWISVRLAQGLAHAHERGILHRDLKPANVLLTDDGQPMLLDFNLSEDIKTRTASAARMGGTLPYMSPEQLDALRGGGVIDARSDVYSLGLIMFELLTGKPAFVLHPGPVHAVLPRMLEDRRQPPPRLRPHNPRVSPAVESIVRRCLEPDPARRYQSAQELQEDLERQLTDRPLRHAPEPSLAERLRKWGRRNPRLTSSTTFASLVGVILLMLPAALAVRQQRLRRLEALDTLGGFREEVRAARFLLDKVEPGRKQLLDGAALCERALGRYRVLDDAGWADGPAVRDLPGDSDREALGDEVREALLSWARAAALLAEQESVPARRRERAELGLRLVGLAESGHHTGKAALVERAELNSVLGRDEEARRLRREADGLAPAAAYEFYRLALRHGDRREFGRALPLLREATRRNPQDGWAWFYQGYCHQEAAEDREAVRCYTACIAVAPRLAGAFLPYFNRGLAYARLGEFAEACADFDEALRLRPDSAEACLNRGIARREWGKHADAVRDFDRALELDPSVTRVYFLRAEAREKSGDKAGARRDRELGMAEEPTDELSYLDRGLARVDGDPAGALADFDKALGLNPRSLLALQNKAHVLAERLHKPEEAVAALDRAVQLYPGFVRSRVGRGVVLARLGRRAAAVADAREALARDNRAETFYQAANIFALTSKQNPDDRREALPLLSIALRNGFGLDFVDQDPDLEPVRKDPEFVRVVQAARDLRAASGQNAP
jgi:serine/threonine protein kinase/Flp pilus assembly protein TadD